MKYITEYRDKELAKKLVADIAKEARADKNYRLMEFCGGHTHVISRYGLEGILPKNVRMIHGPGCPVCVMPIGRIDSAIELALEHGVILCTYADTMRVPASKGLSLMKAKAQGGDIRMIYSAADCLDIARANPDKNVVFCHRRGFKASQGRRLKELLCFLQSCSDASGHAPYPEEPGKSPN